MQVHELMEILRDCEPTDLVVLASDAEGNDYRLLADTNHQDYFYHSEYEELKDEEQIGTTPCVVLWPV